ncbi:MAG: superoxide dismutase family protein [Bacteroidota bacterium]
MKHMSFFSIGLLAVVFATLPGHAQDQMKGMNMGQALVVKAVCMLYPTTGNLVTGIVTFTKIDGGVKVVADVQGLTPGKHGFHVHECGDCTASDGTSAGGHFNPGKMDHGAPVDMMRHEGDLGNLEADASGKAHLEFVDPVIQLDGPGSIIGRSMIVHAKEDDLKTQPTGNAGPRIACGVIGIGK